MTQHLSLSFYKISGFVMLGLGVIGIVVPLLPTTPFLLVSAGCFSKSSERWHNWLLANPTFGPMIMDWHERRCVNCKTKVVALLSMLLVGGSSVVFGVDIFAVKVFALALMAVGAAVVLSIKNCTSA
ncbi:YbaN family protein [Spongiibacter sp. KMU-158]|uniref:Inner membrane protein n=1 Tax=Spongiibacter pelagi TaxID=2760804 RepID=A0A927BYX3_9GAMM|nr:YbaN family protein [Spongiibacter pelagi]MBD2858134.1 YbaN family protein [Spongiibacter pelagi]